MKQRFRRPWSILLCLVMLMTLLPGLELTALAEEPGGYALWVGGVQVTEENAADVFGDGTVRFTPAQGEETAVLELNGYSYSGAGYVGDRVLEDGTSFVTSAALYYEEDSPLTIRLTGTNVLAQTCDETVDQAVGVISTGRSSPDLRLVGTDAAASLRASAGPAADYSAGIESSGVLQITDLRVEAAGGACGLESNGVYSGASILIRGSELRASAGDCVGETARMGGAVVACDALKIENSSVSARTGDCPDQNRGINGRSALRIADSTVSVALGASKYGCGVISNGAVTIVGSELQVDATAASEDADTSYGIFAQDTLTIRSSEAEVRTGPADWSMGTQSYDADVTIRASRLETVSGAAGIAAVGLSVGGSLVIDEASEVTARAGDAPTEGDTFSCGIDVNLKLGVNGEGTRVDAAGAAGVQSYGLCTNEGTTIGAGAAVLASGRTEAVYGTVKNASAGVGWTAPDGSGEGETVPANADGAALPQYLSLRFGRDSAARFSDAEDADAWFYNAVYWAAEQDILAPAGAGVFGVSDPCSRGETVLSLWKLCGAPEPLGAENPFADVSPSDPYYRAVLWACETGVTCGVSADRFAPEAGTTRGQALTLLYRAFGVSAPADGANPFRDVRESDYFCAPVLWAVAEGVTRGVSADRFAPDAALTRGQMITLLYRRYSREAGEAGKQLPYHVASKEEGAELMLSNQAYYDGFSQNDLDFKRGVAGATMEDYQAFAREQVRDFTAEEAELIDGCFEEMERRLAENGYTLPPLEEIVLIKTTMAEECDAGGYTHGTQIYLGGDLLQNAACWNEYQWWYQDYVREILWHELFHCLTRSNPEFRKEMYALIHFTVRDADYPIPPSVMEYHISNPDVEHHNSYATFRIDGKEIDCFTDLVTTRHFETPGESFFDCCTTALIPVDGTDVYYTPEQAENFDEVFGTNTGYVIDPEECMADNFAYAMYYGMDGPDGEGYPNPEIITGIYAYLTR